MREVVFAPCDPFFLQEVKAGDVRFQAEDYLFRLGLLRERLREKGLTHAVLYGDREHFSNIEYFTSYDCRFEESLLVVDAQGGASILVGNEGLGYSEQIPYEINRVLYQNFSLQGQPRQQLRNLSEIFGALGITARSRVGLAGYKYYEGGFACGRPYAFDVPAYILHELHHACGEPNIIDFTKELTGYPNGIRMRLHNAKDIAWAEYAGNRTANVMLNLLKNLKPGVSEFELSQKSNAGFDLTNVCSIVSFGERGVALGLKSPLMDVRLQEGDVCALCYSLRGNNTARVGVAATCQNSYREELKPYLRSFYMKHWEAMAAWYETASVACSSGALYDAVMSRIGGAEFGVALNPGHNVSTDEWTNSSIYKNSPVAVHDGSHIQVDIIASNVNPVRVSICEDAVVIASGKLRAELEAQYPEAYRRIVMRQQKIREVLNINLSDDVLPMSNLNAVCFPFMLNTDTILAYSAAE